MKRIKGFTFAVLIAAFMLISMPKLYADYEVCTTVWWYTECVTYGNGWFDGLYQWCQFIGLCP